MPYKKYILFPDSDTTVKLRKRAIEHSEVIVIKAGTRLLANITNLKKIISYIAYLKKRGKKIILVSSGAVGMGMEVIGCRNRPNKLSDIQALAAMGQSRLMGIYEKECKKYGFHAAQLLLTADGLRNRERHINVLNCIRSLWAIDALPIVNENDSVSVDELKFGDNDELAALIALMCRAKLTIVLTTVDGLYAEGAARPETRISVVKRITKEVKSLAGGTDNRDLSIGGMTSKISAAEIVTSAGDFLWIADGRKHNIISAIFNGEDTGTLFVPANNKQMRSKKRWLNFFSSEKGALILDSGAVSAIRDKGKSLLPSGIMEVKSKFKRGDTIALYSSDREFIGKGLSNYASGEIEKIKGRQTSDIFEILGYITDDEVVHRNNMVIINTG